MAGEQHPASWLAIGFAIQVVACAIVGTRLLLLAARTRKLPELSFGLAFVILGVIGFPVSVAGRVGLTKDPVLAGWLLGGGLAAQNLGTLAIAVGTWKVFRPGHASTALGVAALAVLFALSIAGHHLSVGFEGGNDSGFWYFVGLGTRTLATGWATVESIRFYRMMRRRLRLGIAQPVVADRFRLWSIATGAITLGYLSFAASRILGVDPATSTTVLSASCAIGIACGASLWLAFFPPRRYLAWVAGPPAAKVA